MDKDRAFECKRLHVGKHIVKDEGQMGSEGQAGLATAGADLEHDDVSFTQRDDKSSDIRHDRQRIVPERQNLIPKVSPHGV